MVAATTTLMVISVPVKSRVLGGLDSLYSIVQMPDGVPVATMVISAIYIGHKVITLDPAADCPASRVAEIIVSPYET